MKTGRVAGSRLSDCIITCRAAAPAVVKGGKAGALRALLLTAAGAEAIYHSS